LRQPICLEEKGRSAFLFNLQQAQDLAVWAEGLMGRIFFILSMLLFFISCASSPIELSSTKFVPSYETIVFGRVKVIDREKPVTWGSSPLERGFRRYGGFTIFIVPDTGREPLAYELSADGSFYWHLPKGRYHITGFHWSRGSFIRGGQIPARFEVPEGQSAVYLGTLTMVFQGGSYALRVENEYQQAQQNLKSKFPEITGDSIKNLLQLEVTQ
jgi:hypothetical protein